MLTTLLNEDTKAAIDYFRKHDEWDIQHAFKEIQKIRKMVIAEDAVLNIRTAFCKVGISFETGTSVADTLLLLTQMEIRMMQVRQYLKTENEIKKMRNTGPKIVGITKLVWAM